MTNILLRTNSVQHLRNLPILASIVDTGERTSLGAPISETDFADFFDKFKGIGVLVSGICTVIALALFVLAISRLSTSASNDMARAKALKQILWSGIALALFGGITVVVGVFWNAFAV